MNSPNFWKFLVWCPSTRKFISPTTDQLHGNILKSLRNNIRGIAQQWFKSYLSNRKQFVSAGGIDSHVENLFYGVPQVSILWPIIFIIYINYLPSISKLSKLIHSGDCRWCEHICKWVMGRLSKYTNKVYDLSNINLQCVNCNGLILNLKKRSIICLLSIKILSSKNLK